MNVEMDTNVEMDNVEMDTNVEMSMDNGVYPDGIAIAPKEVTEYSAWVLFGPAIKQAKFWHEPTNFEKDSMFNLLSAFHRRVLEKKPILEFSKEISKDIIDNASKLKLDVCRCVKNETDSILIFYTKKGVKDYSGPFLILRETNPSNVIILSPHDGSDGTNVVTKLAIQNSKALAMISNGHPKGISNKSDFVDHGDAMGSIVLRQIQNIFKALGEFKAVILMIHGKAGNNSISYRSRSKPLANAFEKGSKRHTNIKHFDSFNADYATDKIVATPYYLKCEIPVRIHRNNKNAVTGMVTTIEEYPWAWDSTLEPLDE